MQMGIAQRLSQHVRLFVVLVILRGLPDVERTIQVALAIYAIDKAPKRMLKPRKMKVYARDHPPYTTNTYA